MARLPFEAKGDLRPGKARITTSHPDSETVTVTVAGELDLATAPQLRLALHRLVRAGVRNLLIDLSAVTFIDSTALSVLVATDRALPAGAALVLVGPSSAVLRTISVAGLDGVFAIAATEEAALVALSERGS